MMEQETDKDTTGTIKDLQVELSKKIREKGVVQKFDEQMKRTRPFMPKTERFLKIPNQQWAAQNNSRS